MAQCVTKVQLTISCQDLMDKDVGSKSDPLCVLLQNTGADDQWIEVTLFNVSCVYFSKLLTKSCIVKETPRDPKH